MITQAIEDLKKLMKMSLHKRILIISLVLVGSYLLAKGQQESRIGIRWMIKDYLNGRSWGSMEKRTD